MMTTEPVIIPVCTLGGVMANCSLRLAMAAIGIKYCSGEENDPDIKNCPYRMKCPLGDRID